jgi:hypothetical protein
MVTGSALGAVRLHACKANLSSSSLGGHQKHGDQHIVPCIVLCERVAQRHACAAYNDTIIVCNRVNCSDESTY